MHSTIQPASIPFPLPVYLGNPHACPYLPDRIEQDLLTLDPRIDPPVYQRLMDAGFRRSGLWFYKPQCAGCRECVPIRVPVARFAPSRSQRRVMRRNEDVRLEVGRPAPNPEKWRVYSAYQAARRDRRMGTTWQAFVEFLYGSPIETVEMVYWLGRRIVGVGLVDVCPQCLSSVYFYYDPAFARRSLGVFSALAEIEESRRRGLPYWYVGFYVRDCRMMNYKAQYRPHELLGADGVWRPPEDGAVAQDRDPP